MSKIEELDSLLQSLQALKPPGASKSKIAAITTICIENVHLDATIAQKLYSHFKKFPPTHKLGILFVVDSVTRQWIEKAKQAGQELTGTSALNGTYASGVQRITELMPSLLDDMVRVAPQDQKVKVLNLVDIWERGNTFPARMLADFKQKMSGPVSQVPSKTPPGSPPVQLLQSLGLRKASSRQNAPPPPPPAAMPQVNPNDAAGLLKALSGLSNPALSSPAPPPPVPHSQPAPPQDLSALLAGLGQNGAVPPPPMPTVSTPSQYPPNFPPIGLPQPPPPAQNPPPLPPQFASMFPGAAPPPFQQAPPPPQPAQNPLAALAALLPPNILNNSEQLSQVIQLFSELTKANIPQDQWGPVLAALYPQQSQQVPAPLPSPASPRGWQPPSADAHADTSYGTYNGTSRKRDRSRSPDYRRDRGAAVPRRPSPVYGAYDPSAKNAYDENNDSDRGRRQGGGGRFRQRSPLGAHNGDRLSTPPIAQHGANNAPKWVAHDPTLPRDHIKVLSRTLFVGGCTAPEPELRAIFSRFGQVQTCITNTDKRHAFVKMCTRAGSVAAKQGMEDLAVHDPALLAKARQTKWGVGFGPRECCDYTSGESVIPINSLTEADLKWCLTAEYGGTGGRPVESGMVMEEPDIEIGAGVSSKAMSKRVGPEGAKGRGGGGGRDHGGRGRFRKGGGGGGDGGGQHGGQNHQQQQQHHGGGMGMAMAGGVQQGYGAQQGQQQGGRYQSPRPQEQVAFQPPPPVPNFGFSFAMPGSGGPPY